MVLEKNEEEQAEQHITCITMANAIVGDLTKTQDLLAGIQGIGSTERPTEDVEGTLPILEGQLSAAVALAEDIAERVDAIAFRI